MKRDSYILFLLTITIVLFGFFLFTYEPSPEARQIGISDGSIVLEQIDAQTVRTFVQSSEAGFITLHESMGPAPTETIAVSEFFPAGTHELLLTQGQDLIPGMTYIALLRVDDGDSHYHQDKDKPAVVGEQVVRADIVAREYAPDGN